VHKRLREAHEMRIPAAFCQNLLLLLCLLCTFACDETDSKTTVRFISGDSLHWANPDYDDSHWQTEKDNPDIVGDYFWVRIHSRDDRLGEMPNVDPGIWIGIFTPTELYWNGEFIGSNLIENAPIESDSARLFTTLPITNPAAAG